VINPKTSATEDQMTEGKKEKRVAVIVIAIEVKEPKTHPRIESKRVAFDFYINLKFCLHVFMVGR
jgi:hypothetical protein